MQVWHFAPQLMPEQIRGADSAGNSSIVTARARAAHALETGYPVRQTRLRSDIHERDYQAETSEEGAP